MCSTHGQRLLLIAATLAALLLMVDCRSRIEKIEPQTITASEPENYSATVVRVIEDGDRREVIETRVARAGELFREEWIEAGERRALIIRPDLGKRFLLSFDRRVYVESSLENPSSAATGAIDENDAKEIDSAFNLPPERIETITLADQTIDGHPCQVVERRAATGEGQSEITRLFLARDFAGLAIRVEIESSRSPGLRVITERRDVQTQVNADEFNLPAGFKLVDRIAP